MQAYKIIHFDKTIGSIVVEFSKELAPVAIDIPINDAGNYITGEELDQYVQGFIPTWFLDRKAKIANGIPNESVIESLVQPNEIPAETLETQEISNEIMSFENYEAEKLIAKTLLKWGILTEDPTIIETTRL